MCVINTNQYIITLIAVIYACTYVYTCKTTKPTNEEKVLLDTSMRINSSFALTRIYTKQSGKEGKTKKC